MLLATRYIALLALDRATSQAAIPAPAAVIGRMAPLRSALDAALVGRHSRSDDPALWPGTPCSLVTGAAALH